MENPKTPVNWPSNSLLTRLVSLPHSKAGLSYSHRHITKNARNTYTSNGSINHAIEICVHGRSKMQKHQSIRHEILILFIVNVYRRFFLERD